MKNIAEKFILAGLIGLLILNISNNSKIDKLENKIENLGSQVYGLEDNINSISDNIKEEITDTLEKENSLISKFTYDFNSFENGKMSLNLRVLPKEFSPEAKYYFSYLLKDGSSKRVEANINEANYLLADIELPFIKDIQINYIEELNSKMKIENLNSLDTIEDDLLGPFNLEEGPSTTSFGESNDEKLLDNIYMISYDFNYNSFENDQGIKSAEVYLSLDGDIIDSFPMNKKESISDSNREIYEYHFKDYKLDFKEKDMIEVYAIAQHSKGFKVKLLLGQIYKDVDYQVGDEVFYTENWEEMKSLIYED